VSVLGPFLSGLGEKSRLMSVASTRSIRQDTDITRTIAKHADC
jgi:hypothetical protein